MQPILNEGVSFDCYTDCGTTKIVVKNPDGNTYKISERLADVLLSADGTHNINISPSLLKKLKAAEILKTSRFTRNGIFTYLFTVLPIGARAELLRPFAKIANKLLPAASLMTLIIGIVSIFFSKESIMEIDVEINAFFNVIYTALIIMSALMHELGHLNAAIAYGREVHDIGILTLFRIIPIGAYVSYSPSPEEKNYKEEFCISIAGLQMQLIMFGWCLCGIAFYSSARLLCIMVGACNLAMILLNALPIAGFDGFAAVAALLNVDDLSTVIDIVLRSECQKKFLSENGLIGKAILTFMYLTKFLKVAFVLYEIGTVIWIITDIF